jgi:hypothetical protein
VSGFLEQAERVLNASDRAPEGVSVLCDSAGRLTLVCDPEWPLDSLRRERGAAMAFRVHHRSSRTVVEGRAFNRACLLARTPPAETARRLLNPAIPPAGTAPLLPAASD